jgi:enoyl-CoA hydratase
MTNAILNVDIITKVATIKLNREQYKNAINFELSSELELSLYNLDNDENVNVIMLLGSDAFFSYGADIKQLMQYTALKAHKEQLLGPWDFLAKIKKPVIACVSGFALGGGCELALMCDIIIASSTAIFAQPEVKLGLIPGAGATQRLVRSIGKAAAMDICLSAKSISAFEALNMGIISRVSEPEDLLKDAYELANNIAKYPLSATMQIKQCINNSYEYPMQASLNIERQAFYNLLDDENAQEGMLAFIEKRAANFKL